jgi:hypothetical protein
MEDRSLNKEIIKLVEDKLDFGQKKYGSDVTLMDKRDWGEEGLEEAIDMIVYLAAELIRLRALKKELNELLILIKEKQDD